MIKVAVDAMGGDNAPEEIVAGAVMAANTRKDIKILLVGQEERVSAELKKHTYNTDQIEIVNATEVIETEEPPVNAIRKKKDSSIVVGMNMVRRDEADAFVSAGSSGAILVGGQVIIFSDKLRSGQPFDKVPSSDSSRVLPDAEDFQRLAPGKFIPHRGFQEGFPA